MDALNIANASQRHVYEPPLTGSSELTVHQVENYLPSQRPAIDPADDYQEHFVLFGGLILKLAAASFWVCMAGLKMATWMRCLCATGLPENRLSVDGLEISMELGTPNQQRRRR